MLAPKLIKQNLGAFRFYLLIVSGFCVCGYFGYRMGLQVVDSQADTLNRSKQTIQNLRVENDLLTRKLNVLGVQLDVEKMAAQHAQSSIQEGLNREAELKKQLNFYQRIMAPELTQEGFRVEEINIIPAASEHHFHFEIVLMQLEKIKRVVKGDINITLHGSQDRLPKTIALTDLLTKESHSLQFSFKYFQLIEGQFSLPENFIPEQIVVEAEIFQFKRKKGDFSTNFSWQESIQLSNGRERAAE